MRKTIFRMMVAASFAAPVAAYAQSRASTTNMSCAAASNLVQAQGAVVLGTGRDTFDRFVSHAGFCAHGQITKPAFVPAANNPQCYIGSRCYDPDYQIR